MRVFSFLVFTFFALFLIKPSFAACTNPDGEPGEIIFNADHDIFQGCVARGWMALGGDGGGGGFSGLSCSNRQLPQWDGSQWVCTYLPGAYCDRPWGGTVNSGSSIDAFDAETPVSCIGRKITRLCTDGVLAGSSAYQYATCTPTGCTLGEVWNLQTVAGPASWNAMAEGGGSFVAVGLNGNIATSADGVSWTVQTVGVYNWTSVAYGAGVFIAVGNNRIARSTDGGTTWTDTPGGSYNFTDITYGNSLFLLVGNLGATGGILTTADGVTYGSMQNPVATSTWQGAVYAAGKFVVVGRTSTGTGTSVSSTTGTSGWSSVGVPGGAGTNPLSVTHDGSQFVAVGNSNIMVTSPTGTTWTLQTAPGSWNDIVYGGGKLIAVGNAGRIGISTDGVSWHTQVTGGSTAWRGAMFSGGKFYAMGSASTIAVSDCP